MVHSIRGPKRGVACSAQEGSIVDVITIFSCPKAKLNNPEVSGNLEMVSNHPWADLRKSYSQKRVTTMEIKIV